MQRVSPVDISIEPDMTISRGQTVVVDMVNRFDQKLYPNADTFLPDRFVRLREDPAYGSKAILTTTSQDHLAFGHGNHACPGRFFVDVKVKMILCQLLLAYDWRLVSGTPTKPHAFGVFLAANMKTRLHFRRRSTMELDLGLIASVS